MAARKKRDRYNPFPAPAFKPKQPVRLVRTPFVDGVVVEELEPRDPMADYIEEGASWWLATSDVCAADLRKMFDDEDVAGVLIERVGAILPRGQPENGKFPIALQLVRVSREESNWDVDLALEDIGVYLDELWDPEVHES